MKQLLFVTLVTFSSLFSIAQSEKYVGAMKANIDKLYAAQTPEEYKAVAAAFERIADAEKNQWLPYYYASLAHVWRGFRDQSANKDEVAAKASSLLTKAEALETNAETAIVKNMIATIQMLVDPMTRFQTYGMEANKALVTAKKLDPENPRIYYLEGQSLMGTPAQFGGGKDKAKPVFQKSVQLYETFKPASELHPSWGKKNAEKLLEQCN
ncbi:hypothetical protein [Aridibaculum aurantiacum]|uniref:hypothetical protein n=1 Tax=Aridibaculum aurantiacum TaxID=2810307 RepID=UPI001A95AD73|nr:hypothetical protein [Aridibaculum aurantiacum]